MYNKLSRTLFVFLSTLGVVFFLFTSPLAPVYGADPYTVKLQVPIAGMDTDFKVCTESASGSLECDGIARFLTQIYAWLITMASVLAIVVLMVGGLRWMTARGDEAGVTAAKKIISNALIGLVLLLGSYTLLYLVNPKLTQFKTLSLGKPVTEEAKLNIKEIIADETNANQDSINNAPGMTLEKFPNLKFQPDRAAIDVEAGALKQNLINVFTSLDQSGIQGIYIGTAKTGHSPCVKGTPPNCTVFSNHWTGKAADIPVIPVGIETLRKVTKYLFDNHAQLGINELYFSYAPQYAIEACKEMDPGYLARSGLFGPHLTHVHVAVGCP